jgi:5-methylcytosine-specific restriction endonuclease McrA
MREHHRRYREQNRQEIKERARAWRKSHPEKIRTYTVKYRHKNYEATRKREQKQYERRMQENPDSVRMWGRLAAQRRKARRLAAQGVCTKEQFMAKCEYFGWRCYLCGIKLNTTSVQMEHRKPLSRGGANWPANLAPACAGCNYSKGTKTEAEFRVWLVEHCGGRISAHEKQGHFDAQPATGL